MQTPGKLFKILAGFASNPSHSHPRALTSCVWITAKEVHGHPLSLERMDRVGALEDTVDVNAVRTAAQTRRIRAKVQSRAILIGQTKPTPLILIDALPGKAGYA